MKNINFGVFVFLCCGQRCACGVCFTELAELLDTGCRFHAVKIVTILCSEYLPTQYFLFCLSSQGGVSRSSDGIKPGEQGPELGELFTKVTCSLEPMVFLCCIDRTAKCSIEPKLPAGM